jgi:ABC-type transport system involved in multi-copper enzyme maturation permease subunit
MNRLLGLLSFLLALFLLPMTLRLLSDALGMYTPVNGESSGHNGAWIIFGFLSSFTLLTAWMGIKIIRKA